VSRPKPKVLLELIDKKTFKLEEVLEAEDIWAVYYKDKPINIKISNYLTNKISPKYKKISFSNSGHAFNLAEKLNKVYKCNDFSVYKLTTGEKVHEIKSEE
jgi:hypothetical protein